MNILGLETRPELGQRLALDGMTPNTFTILATKRPWPDDVAMQAWVDALQQIVSEFAQNSDSWEDDPARTGRSTAVRGRHTAVRPLRPRPFRCHCGSVIGQVATRRSGSNGTPLADPPLFVIGPGFGTDLSSVPGVAAYGT